MVYLHPDNYLNFIYVDVNRIVKETVGVRKNKLKCLSACGCGPETCDQEIISDIED